MSSSLDTGRWRLPRPGRRPGGVPAWPVANGLRLLIVECEEDKEFSAELTRSGVSVTWCALGSDALVSFGRIDPDAVLIAPQLPDLAPAEVVRALRRFGAQPILLGIGASDAQAAGPILVAGATAAVARPYVAREILEQISGSIPDLDSRLRLTFGPLTLDPGAHTVHFQGVELSQLPLKEFELLRLLMGRAEQVVSAEQIRSALWSASSKPPSANAIAVHATRLRTRLQAPVELRTIRGLGYRLTLTDEPA